MKIKNSIITIEYIDEGIQVYVNGEPYGYYPPKQIKGFVNGMRSLQNDYNCTIEFI
jgi:hypothetical protein